MVVIKHSLNIEATDVASGKKDVDPFNVLFDCSHFIERERERRRCGKSSWRLRSSHCHCIIKSHFLSCDLLLDLILFFVSDAT